MSGIGCETINMKKRRLQYNPDTIQCLRMQDMIVASSSLATALCRHRSSKESPIKVWQNTKKKIIREHIKREETSATTKTKTKTTAKSAQKHRTHFLSIQQSRNMVLVYLFWMECDENDHIDRIAFSFSNDRRSKSIQRFSVIHWKATLIWFGFSEI